MSHPPVQDSGVDLHPSVTHARSLTPRWRERAHDDGYEWREAGAFHCRVVRVNDSWLAVVEVWGAGGTATWRKPLPNYQSAQQWAAVALTHLLTLQDASEFWRATL